MPTGSIANLSGMTMCYSAIGRENAQATKRPPKAKIIRAWSWPTRLIRLTNSNIRPAFAPRMI